jgi:hypothetical protein
VIGTEVLDLYGDDGNRVRWQATHTLPGHPELALDGSGQLRLSQDPKLAIARRQPWLYPVDVNTAPHDDLLRLPGVGPLSAKRIMSARREHRIDSLEQLKKMRDEISEMIKVEGEKYRDTLVRGNDLVKRYLNKNKNAAVEQLVDFYESHGLTPEDVSEVAALQGIQIKIPGDFYALIGRKHMKTASKLVDVMDI